MKALGALVLGLLMGAAVSWGGDAAREQQARDAYVHWLRTGTALPEEKALMEEVLFSEALANRLDSTFSRDDYGYEWVDNQMGDTTIFDWVELCGDPDAQFGPTGDDVAGQIGWGFPFPFYGVTYTSAYVSTNGKIAFGNPDATWSNQCLPADAAQPAISVHWDDLVADQTADCGDGTARIKFRDFGDHFVIEWKDVWHYPYPYADQRSSFEAILWTSGKIKMQFDSVRFFSNLNSCTVGIDVPGSNGVEYVCNGLPADRQLEDHRAVWFYPPDAPPPAPQALTAKSSGDDLVLYWLPVPSAANYNVYRDSTSEVETIPANLIATVTDTTYADVGVINTLSTYFYCVTATP